MARIKYYDPATNSWKPADFATSEAEFVAYDKEKVYSDGTVGKALQDGSVPEVTDEDNEKALVVKDGEWTVDNISGLPDASEAENGTALVVVDGEWTKQEGYGYKLSDTIEWDGNKEGKISVYDQESTGYFVKVSDRVFSKNELMGNTVVIHSSESTSTNIINEISILGEKAVKFFSNISCVAGTYNIYGYDATFPEDGTYFYMFGTGYYTTKLSIDKTVTINNHLSGIPIIIDFDVIYDYDEDTYQVSGSLSPEEFMRLYESEEIFIGRMKFNGEVLYGNYAGFEYAPVTFIFTDENKKYYISEYEGSNLWGLETKRIITIPEYNDYEHTSVLLNDGAELMWNDSIESLFNILPPNYHTGTNYKPGDICMHNNYMYQCTAATTGTWNPAYWTQTYINNTATLHYEEV